MNNFGVIELASAKTTSAPGWAYVPDTGITPEVAALRPAQRKRARNAASGSGGGGLSQADQSVRQDNRVRKELEALDKDGGGREAQIAIPAKAGGRGTAKHTPAVRKILQSQKTFANHLDDFHALENQQAQAASASAAAATTAASRRRAESGKASEPPPPSTAGTADKDKDIDEPMGDAAVPGAGSAILTPYTRPAPTAHAGDADPLLASRVLAPPTDAELRALVAAAPLTYAEARGGGGAGAEARYPVRAFCEVCGYWGRVRCMLCGARCCALDCLEEHRVECRG